MLFTSFLERHWLISLCSDVRRSMYCAWINTQFFLLPLIATWFGYWNVCDILKFSQKCVCKDHRSRFYLETRWLLVFRLLRFSAPHNCSWKSSLTPFGKEISTPQNWKKRTYEKEPWVNGSWANWRKWSEAKHVFSASSPLYLME